MKQTILSSVALATLLGTGLPASAATQNLGKSVYCTDGQWNPNRFDFDRSNGGLVAHFYPHDDDKIVADLGLDPVKGDPAQAYEMKFSLSEAEFSESCAQSGHPPSLITCNVTKPISAQIIEERPAPLGQPKTFPIAFEGGTLQISARPIDGEPGGFWIIAEFTVRLHGNTLRYSDEHADGLPLRTQPVNAGCYSY